MMESIALNDESPQMVDTDYVLVGRNAQNENDNNNGIDFGDDEDDYDLCDDDDMSASVIINLRDDIRHSVSSEFNHAQEDHRDDDDDDDVTHHNDDIESLCSEDDIRCIETKLELDSFDREKQQTFSSCANDDDEVSFHVDLTHKGGRLGSRLTNKKRRKKMKLLKKAAAAAAAAAALADSLTGGGGGALGGGSNDKSAPRSKKNNRIHPTAASKPSRSLSKKKISNIAVACATKSYEEFRQEHNIRPNF